MKLFIPIVAVMLFCGQCFAQRADGSRPAGETRPAASIESFTQNLKKYEGFFTFFYDYKTGKIYLEVDENQFNKEFLYFSALVDGIGNGGAERGQASAELAKFIKVGPKIFLLEPNLKYRSVKGSADEQQDVENAFAKSIIFGFAPVAVEGDKVLVDLTPFIIRDAQKIGDRIGSGSANAGSAAASRGRGAVNAGGGYRVDESRSAVYLDNTKNFPKNTEFEAVLTFAGNGRGNIAPDASSVTVNMHQSFVELPDGNYKPRKFDPRAGYFGFSYLDFSAPMSEPLEKRFIERHRLAKKDPLAAVSEPVEPIVYYIDRGAPPLIQKALVEGGSWWNQAFEAAGYKNAFIVKVLPEGADPMDIRYNIVNWVNRSAKPARAFSYGASYIDPRTGEIIKGMVTLGSDRHREDYLIAEGLLQPYIDGKPVPKDMEEMALARIRQLSAHEIGHTLGLTHNFAASPNNRSSVMDYPFPRFSLKADGTVDLSDVYAKGIGGWDKRAIMWGYSDFGQGANEDAELDKITRKTLGEGFVYAPDASLDVHPMSSQWDDGANPIDQLNKLMTVRKHILDNFSEKAIPKGSPMATLEEVLVPMYLLHRYQVLAAAKSIGGLYYTHAIKNDGQVTTQIVDPAEQWRAFDAVMNTITPDALALPEALIEKIPPRPTGYPSSVETFGGHTGSAFDPIAAAETAADYTLATLFDAERAARLIEYNARDPKRPGLMAMIDKILESTWKAPAVPGYKGELQILVDDLTLKHLLGLAADNNAAANVKGEALLKVHELKEWMAAKQASAEPRQKAALYYGLQQIEEFEKDPGKFQPAPALEMPPGAPIGMD
ncbi:peptidase [Mucilaginibacter sp. PPCGB 2223]|uniref:zinc-dependent metalloprotease n=1 Tax=Mucilaginibacter sp. PPCGB 2223 TaxID=1886027 RepID=UPI0008253932|nr:zinc-dependent metalloprotease [Mucilaginibacter sp. PPCGB 2223]OCX51181.1 peptidase [Mucilaginibacter sp. PPCGB 2223]